MTQGHFLTLTTAQVHALGAQLAGGHWGSPGGPPRSPSGSGCPTGGGSARRTPATRSWPRRSRRSASSAWRRCSTGRWPAWACSSAPGAGSGRFGGAAGGGPVLLVGRGAAVRLARLHADVHRRLADRGGHRRAAVGGARHGRSPRRRTWAGLAGFAALEAATFARYTDIVVLGCAVVAVLVAWRLRAARLPRPRWAGGWASVAVFAAGVAVFDDLVYGGPLTSGYRPGRSRSASARSRRTCGTCPRT